VFYEHLWLTRKYINKWSRRPKKETARKLMNYIYNCCGYIYSYKESNILTVLGFKQDLFSEMRITAELNSR